MIPEGPKNTMGREGSLDQYYVCCSYPKLRRRYFFGKLRCKNCNAAPIFAYTIGFWSTGSTGSR